MPGQQQDVPCAEMGGLGGGTHQLSRSRGAARGGDRRPRRCAGRAGQGERPSAGAGLREGKWPLHSPSWTSLWQKTTGDGVDSSSSLRFRGETAQQGQDLPALARQPQGHGGHCCRRHCCHCTRADRATDTAVTQSVRNTVGTLPRGHRDPSESCPPGTCTGPSAGGHPLRTWDRRDRVPEKPSPPRVPARRLAMKPRQRAGEVHLRLFISSCRL